MAAVALPPGFYTIQRTNNAGDTPGANAAAVTSPPNNGQALTLQAFNANNIGPNQQFLVKGSGVIVARFDRTSFANPQTNVPFAPVKRLTTSVEWIIKVVRVNDDNDALAGWRGVITFPDEHEYSWNSNGAVNDQIFVNANPTPEWFFRPVPRP